MKRSKKTVLGVILLIVVITAVCLGLRGTPGVDHALRISGLLQPMMEAQDQTLHVAVSAEVDADTIGWESDVYLITEGDTRFLVLEQRGTTLYIADHVLFLENGKAFRLGDEMQTHVASYWDLLPRIGALYDILKITEEETGDGAVYEITVNAEQADALLALMSLEDALPVQSVKKLDLSLAEKNGELESIRFSGNGNLDGTAVAVQAELSDFRILAPGDYPIPEAVKESAANVDPDGLFSLTEDLYRLVLAMQPLADLESIDGTLALAVDCGLIQLDTEMELSHWKGASTGQIDWEQLQALPEMLILVCMEGDVSCTQTGNAYAYALELDQQAIQRLARMILPELGQYSGNLTEGSVRILLEGNAVTSMRVAIGGKIKTLLGNIPVSVAAEFEFA